MIVVVLRSGKAEILDEITESVSEQDATWQQTQGVTKHLATARGFCFCDKQVGLLARLLHEPLLSEHPQAKDKGRAIANVSGSDNDFASNEREALETQTMEKVAGLQLSHHHHVRQRTELRLSVALRPMERSPSLR